TKEPLGNSGVYTPAGAPPTGRPTPLRNVARLRVAPPRAPRGPAGGGGQVLGPRGGGAPRRPPRGGPPARPHAPGRGAGRGRRPRLRRRRPRRGEAARSSPDGRTRWTSTEGGSVPVHELRLAALPAGPAPPPPAASRPAAQPGRAKPGTDGDDAFTALVVSLGLAVILVWGGGKVASVARRD